MPVQSRNRPFQRQPTVWALTRPSLATSAVTAVKGDVALPETATDFVSKAVEAFGRVDVMVSNAGICPFHAFLDMPVETVDRTFRVNLHGAYYMVQAAANQVVSTVPGADAITLGGTRPSATDPCGHPSGKALDYMVLSDTALGNAIVEYHIGHWDELGVEYIIYRQRILQSPNGSWSTMENRGSPTANHMDHVHVNYR